MTEIKEMSEESYLRVAEIDKLCFTDAWSENAFANELKNDKSLTLVAYCDDVIAGYVNLWHIIDTAEINSVAVLPKFRKQGIALQLLSTAFTHFDDLKYINLEVREGNTAALCLYEKLGFKRVGLRKNYYSCPTENAILMTAHVNQRGENR